MEVKQIFEIVNNATSEVLGKSDLLQEDLSNIVDVGTEILDADAMDNYVKSLVNKIGKSIFITRKYRGKAPAVLMDAWEFGSVLEKISAELPDAGENASWELEDGKEYAQDVFYKPTVTAKFFNSRVTYEIPVSITERQVKESLKSAEQLNAFISMIYNAVDTSMTIKTEALILRTINNFTAETLNADADAFTSKARLVVTANTDGETTATALYITKGDGETEESLTGDEVTITADDLTDATTSTITNGESDTATTITTTEGTLIEYDGNSTNRAVNLLYLYNKKFNEALAPAQAILTPEFIRFAAYTIGIYTDRISSISTLFNIGAKERFTPAEDRKLILLSEFAKAAGAYLYSDTYNKEYVTLPAADIVPFWQGSGTAYSFDDTSAVNVKTSSNAEIEAGGIIGVLFDRQAVGVTNSDRRVTTAYNAKGEFYNTFFKFDASYYNDQNENYIIFFIA